MKTKHVHILVSDEEYEALKELVYKEKKSLGQIVRELMKKGGLSTSKK